MTHKTLMLNLYRKSVKAVHCEWNRVSHYSSSHWIPPQGYDTGIHMYNSATKSKVPLILKQPQYASWYMCGPTVYDSAHIGHACSYVKMDIIRRILEDYFNISVVLAMNITDIDDKIIHRAEADKSDVQSLTRKYEAEFFQDMESLNVRAASVVTRVSDFMPRIITFISRLIALNHAYVTEDGSVYFYVASYPAYGKLAAIPMQSDGKEEAPHGGKRQAADFALWKAAKEGEPSWGSPWGRGRGRPGWHIECSVMASHVFGTHIDIHSGGIDLLFPHHENCEAQCCCHHAVDRWVNYWLHTGHLHVQGSASKMSKSLKNTVAVSEMLLDHSADHFRVFCLLSKYRHAVEYTATSMENAVAVCRKIESFLSQSDAYIQGRLFGANIDEPALLQSLSACKETIHSAFSDDFDTAKAMGAILDLVSHGNRMLQPCEDSQAVGSAAVAAVAGAVRKTLRLLGVKLADQQTSSSDSRQLSQVLDTLLEFRSEVRSSALENKQQDLLQSCDALRRHLAGAGVSLKDHGKQSSWSFSEQR